MIENPRTGEQIVFEVRTADLLVMHATWTRPGRRAAAHLHPEMEERYEILEGRAAFRVAGQEWEATPGDTIVVPPNTRHLAWNPTDHRVKLRITMRPALRWAEFVERLFTGENAAELLCEFSREIRLAD